MNTALKPSLNTRYIILSTQSGTGDRKNSNGIILSESLRLIETIPKRAYMGQSTLANCHQIIATHPMTCHLSQLSYLCCVLLVRLSWNCSKRVKITRGLEALFTRLLLLRQKLGLASWHKYAEEWQSHGILNETDLAPPRGSPGSPNPGFLEVSIIHDQSKMSQGTIRNGTIGGSRECFQVGS